MTMAILVQETALAWALAEAVKPHLSAIERNHVFMAIGAGETFAAIRGLVRSIAVKRIALRPDLVQQCITWLHAYVGSPHRSGADASLVVSLNGNAAMTIESPPLESRPSDGTC